LKGSKAIFKVHKRKKIIIGPWYIAMDEFLVSGESIIRNLERGFEIANIVLERHKK
jgi:mannosylglycerate hydrolase